MGYRLPWNRSGVSFLQMLEHRLPYVLDVRVIPAPGVKSQPFLLFQEGLE
jgi:hypothetical protein